MSNTTVYGFLSDSGFHLSTGLDLSDSSDQGFGYLHGEASNYLVNKGALHDTRSSRLQILENYAPTGHMDILFDQNRVDLVQLQALAEEDIQHIFNILERCMLAQQYSDLNIENMLTTTSIYTGYVANSHAHDPNVTTVSLSNIQGLRKNVELHDYISFDYNNGTVDITFHIWLKLSAFTVDYPYTTITRVIPPYAPDLLLDGTAVLQATNLDVLSRGSEYIFDQTHTELAGRDQNGVYKFSLKYVLSATTSRNISFALAYCGPKVPTSLDCRAAIKDYIKTTTNVSDDNLKEIFPELYISARFFIVPLWDIYSQLSDRDVYNSTMKIAEITSRAAKVFKNREPGFVERYMELLLNSQNKMWSMCLPDALNTTHMSIIEQHPTYVDYSTQNVGWKYMTAATQEFAGKLIRCMAVLRGESTSSEFITAQESDATYLTFTSGDSEYFVMTRDSYLALVS